MAAEPINVIYQPAEDGLADTIKPRLESSGADCSRVLVIDESDKELTLCDEQLELAVWETSARLIVLDPLQAYLGDNDFTRSVNLFNDFYAKDTSRKIRAVKKAQAEQGERVATRAPYGYKKDENGPKRKTVPDEEVVPVVQRIFSFCAEGKGPSQIAKQLKNEQVYTPGYYYYSKTGVLLTNVDVT